MFFEKLMPREDNYFLLFNQHASKIMDAMNSFTNLVNNYSDLNLREKYIKDVREAEKAADRVTREVGRSIHKTFITPIDREQIHSLINTMDDVADLIQAAAQTLTLYDIQKITDAIISLTDISSKCCLRLQSVVKLLDKIGEPANSEAALKTCEEIDQLESDADHILRSAMSKLFREENDVRELIKLKAMYELLETISDKCEDVANLIEGIVLENS
jgi:hypothetical protein